MTPHLEMCSPAGEVTEACVITNRETGKSRGFGFVNLADKESAKATAASMDDQDGDDISAVRTLKRATYRQAAMVPSRVAVMASSSRVMARALSRHATPASSSSRFTARASYRNSARALSRVTAMTMAPSSRMLSRHPTQPRGSSRFTARAPYRNSARALPRFTTMTMEPSSRDAVQVHGQALYKKLGEGVVHGHGDGEISLFSSVDRLVFL